MTLEDIHGRCAQYKSMKEFRADIAWFLHNCKIVSDRNNSIKIAANNLVAYVDEKIFANSPKIVYWPENLNRYLIYASSVFYIQILQFLF